MLRCNSCLTPTESAQCPRCDGLEPLPTHLSFQALFYVPQGLVQIVRDGELLRLSLIPLGLTGIALCTFLFLGFTRFQSYINHFDFGAAWSNTLLSLVAMGISSVGAIVLFLFLFVPVSTLFSMPFLDPISMRTETFIFGQKQTEDFNWLRLLPELLLLWGLKLTFLLFSLPLLLLPVLGHILFLYALALFTAIDFLDIILMRKQFDFKEKLGFLKRNFGRYCMFALPLTFMLWIPILQLLFIPAATVGAVLFVLHAPKTSEKEIVDA